MRLRALAFAAAATFTVAAYADVIEMVATLSGRQEVPPNSSAAFGVARITVDTVSNTLRYRIAHSNLSSAELDAHIHGPAGIGVNAGVLHGLGVGKIKEGVWNYPQSLEADILGGRTYINIHSANIPGGEIRGQICHLVAELDGVQEVPPIPSPGLGTGIFMIDTVNKQLHYDIRFAGLTGTEVDAHIHGPANYGVNAGVAHQLPLGPVKIGVWNYPPAMEQMILDGVFYINIHSSNFPGGEIRGQIVSSVNPSDALQEVPQNNTSSTGRVFAALDRNLNTYGYDVLNGSLSSGITAAHIHGFSAPGVNSGILHDIGVGTRRIGRWAFPAASLSNILDGLTYVNTHTMNFPGGEIRGQVVWTSVKPDCPADWNGDGQVDFFDYLDFVQDFNDDNADFNGDGQTDFFDYLDFVAAFDQGC